MTKPDDIPQDVLEACSTVRIQPFHWKGPEEVAEMVARAIMAEREACAALAETYRSGMTAAIAAAIRNRGASA